MSRHAFPLAWLRSRRNACRLAPALLFLLVIAAATGASAQTLPVPRITIGAEPSQNPQDVSILLQLLFLFTLLSLAPGIILLTTPFTRIVIVLSMLRRALGLQTMPPNQVLIGLSLFLTYFVMAPTIERINQEALQPYLRGEIVAQTRTVTLPDGRTVEQTVQPFYVMLQKAELPLREFMFRQLGTRGMEDIALFLSMARLDPPQNLEDVPTRVLVPAFVLSELQKAFVIGFLLYLPFLVIDIVTSAVLMSLGMFMLPPIFISVPFKILLFVMVDGWRLVVGNVVRGFVVS